MNNKKRSFESALENLEEIVKKMEDNKLPLYEMMKQFEEGKKLTEFCSKKLTEYEKKIEILVNKKGNNEEADWQDFNLTP